MTLIMSFVLRIGMKHRRGAAKGFNFRTPPTLYLFDQHHPTFGIGGFAFLVCRQGPAVNEKKPGRLDRASFLRAPEKSGAVIHVEFDRRRSHFPTINFRPLQFEVGFDLVLGEHVALQKEVMVGGQRIERFT